MSCLCYLGWSAFVTLGWFALAASIDEDYFWPLFSSSGFIDYLVLLFFPLGIVWLLGLLALHSVLRSRARGASKPTPRQVP